jgi:predicted nucleic acid-binding protein
MRGTVFGGRKRKHISAAFRIEDEARIGFWDALIVTSAIASGATRLLSDGLNLGQQSYGILVENPFAANLRRIKRH